MADDSPFSRLCVRIWADDHDYLRKIKGNLGVNLLIRQIIHSYVTHDRDEKQRQMEALTRQDGLEGLAPVDFASLILTDEVQAPNTDPNQQKSTGGARGTVVEIEI